MSYQTYFQTLTSISCEKKAEMAKIYFRYYEGSDDTRFYSDLAGKNEVLFLAYNNKIVGFTSIQFYPFCNHMIVYSGDTIVVPEHRQQQSLHQAWIGRMGRLKQQYPQQKLYWFLLVKGYKTYKYLVLFAKQFHPHWQFVNSDLANLANALATDKFGELYQPKTGVVECPSSHGHLKQGLTELTAGEKAKESAQFFLQANPHYQTGHELVCICELSEENLNGKFKRCFQDAKAEFCHE